MSSATPDLDAALKGIFKDRDWPLKVMMGGLINLGASTLPIVNPIFLPVSFAMVGLTFGYLLAVLRASIKGDLEKLPDWSGVIDLLVLGLSWEAICLGFGFFTMSVMAISLLVASNTSLNQLANPNYLPWAIGTFLVVYGLLVGFNFFLAVLMANFAEEERMLAGFAWRKVLKRIAAQPQSLLLAWLAGNTLYFGAILLPILTRFQPFFALEPFAAFLAEIIAVRMIGQAWPEQSKS
ncbi:MAG: DUF4013 domain-containing protein [Cyanobacteria bacterium SZAS TMP-1]|nr:DUF4013 domain-containing protein [Cyanobacteria bacterium SZAS TMP-1]